MISLAWAGPMPGKVSSSSAVAVLTLTCAGVWPGLAGFAAALAAFFSIVALAAVFSAAGGVPTVTRSRMPSMVRAGTPALARSSMAV